MLKKISRARLDALRQGWLESRRHLPTARFGPLTALDDSLIRPHTGFNTHPDKNEVLLYYIANGELTHGDSLNNHSVLRRGEALCLHTGTGLRHSELNQSSAPLRLVPDGFFACTAGRRTQLWRAALFVGKPCEPVAFAGLRRSRTGQRSTVPQRGCQRLCGRPHLRSPPRFSH